MRMSWPDRKWRRWLGFFFLGAGTTLRAQTRGAVEEPQWMKLKISEVNVGLEVEGTMEERTLGKSSQSTTREVIYAVPTLGLGLQGSIYHPNLLEYRLNTQDGVGWQESSFSGFGGGTRTGPLSLQRYHGEIGILKEKPYAVSLFAEKDHTTRDYDFFTRATVDSQSYGTRMGYAAGAVPVSLSLVRSEEAIGSVARPSSRDGTALSFTATNERLSEARTDLSYTMNDYTQRDLGLYTQQGAEHSVNLSDTETFGKTNRIRLNSSLFYNHLDSTTQPFNEPEVQRRPIRGFSDNEHMTVKHSGQLESGYGYSYNQRDSGPVSSDTHSGTAALHHQLYASLTSTLEAHGQTLSSSGDRTSLETTRYGVGIHENYTKKLGKSSRLALGYGVGLDQEQRESTGQFLFVAGESHTLKDGTLSFLNQPRVNRSSVRVTDPSGAIQYRELLDYLIIPHGERTEIRRVTGGTITDGGTVLVDYTATAQPSDSFTTLGQQFYVRLDLLKDRLGLYARMSLAENSGGKSLILQNSVDRAVGVDLTVGMFRAGAEYEDFRSNLSPFRGVRLFQSLTREIHEDWNLSLDLAQSWNDFPNSHRKLDGYHFIARSRWRVYSDLSINTEGGVRLQRGQGYDQTLTTFRSDLDFHSGKLVVKAGYEFEDEDYLGELRRRHFFFIRAKRTF